ncbi:MAG: hypothetical protein U1G08_10485 [Verrucomicrobiota bacterium]
MKSAKLVVAWLVVGVPLAWGVFHSVKRSLPLFHGGSRPPAASPR